MKTLRDLLARITKERGEENPFPEDLDAYLDDFVPNLMLKSETLQQAFGVQDDELENMYAEGYSFYNNDQIDDATVLFRWCVLLNPFVKRYWMGLAATQQLQKLYEKALHSYAIAFLLDDEDPYPHYHAYECYRDWGDQEEEAKKALEMAVERCGNSPLHASLRARIGEEHACLASAP